ncbi:MAG TPA: sodium:proton antiporter, partial [Gammaproteobacteria bacterium]|nr:sodium:proton antiporter [Gammaproteobacteria bacterium]
MKSFILMLLLLISPDILMASPAPVVTERLDLTNHWVGVFSIVVFIFAYVLVMSEEYTHLRKSKPVLLSAGIIWSAIALVYASNGMNHAAEVAIRHNLLEYSELMLFLLVAMTYINALSERQVFDALRSWLIRNGFSFRQLFWMTGVLSFFISPVADNMTTALLMCAVVLAVGGDNIRFVSIACINIVVAANAGGAFSPFGDITTLMVWQKGIVDFWTFFALIIPSAVNFLVPAVFMHFAIPDENPSVSDEMVVMRRGSVTIIVLFLLTIVTAVSFHNFMHLPPVFGMMTGLAYLQFYGFYLRKTHNIYTAKALNDEEKADRMMGDVVPFDIFNKVARAEWDTLLFFYGVVLSVGGLGFIGYLGVASELMYEQWGATTAN